MALKTHSVCESCGRIVRTRTITMTGADTNDGIKYVKIDSKQCGCTNSKVHVDVAKGM